MKKLALLFHFIFALFLAGTQLIFAQSFPVQVIPQALPPAPIYFSDYADEGTVTSPLRVQLILNDLQVASKEVRLKASFEGNGIAFESNAIVSGAPLLFLESGIPLNLTNTELAPYFKFENIVGISPNVYGQPIPEGTYRFCFEIFDAFSGNRISDRTCAGTVIFQNDPPILISPLDKSIVEERNPQNIIFQWTPRHINVSNVEYELSIVEIWDNQIDHQAAFLSSPPIFQTTTSATTYLYGPADPQLLSDKNYAWRVQAKAKQGTEEIGLFKNQGYSTIFVFGNTGVCDLPLGINHEVKGATNANIVWDDITSESPEFQIRYRATEGDTEWFYSKTTTNLVTIWDLEAGTEYEYQLAKTCALSESEYSPIKTFRTNLFDTDDSAYECGIAPNIDVTNEVPLANLNTGEKFTAGDFPVTILEVNGSNGYFNGKGYVTIPYLKSIKVAVEFTNIFINELRELKQGNVITVFDPNMSGIIDPWSFVDGVGDIINGGDSVVLPPVDFEIESVTVGGDKIIITGVDSGNNPVTVEYEYDENDTYIVTGENTAYSIDENGNVNEIGPMDADGPATVENTTGLQSGGSGTTNSPSVATIDDSKIQIEYLEKSGAKYGFDHQNNSYEADTYSKAALKSGGDFFPIHKAVKNGDTDSFIIDVTITDTTLKLEDLIFKTVSGIKIETAVVSGKANQLQVNLTGAGGYRNEEAIITYKDEEEKHIVVGSFFVHHLRPVGKVDVEVITVNGASMPVGLGTIAQKFQAAGADINLVPGQNFQGNASALSYTDSGLLRKLPESFRAFATEFKNNSGNYSGNKYYVFVFDNSIDPGSIAGFMPRKTQYGFVFPGNLKPGNQESKNTVEDLLTHEIGHGVFGISHPYNDNNDPENDGLKTDWVMDKGAGNQLAKRDWEAIGDKGLQLYLFDDDDDGTYEPYEGVNYDVLIPRIPNTKDSDILSFVSQAGVIYSISSEAKDITFKRGFLVGFTMGNKRYLANVNKENNTDSENHHKYFVGYTLDDGSGFLKEDFSYSISSPVKVYYALKNREWSDCGESQGILYSANYVGTPVSSNNLGYTPTKRQNIIKHRKNEKYENLPRVNDGNLQIIDSSSQIVEDNILDVFNCLKNGDLKVLYKRIEYALQGKELGFLDEFFIKLNQFKEVFIDLGGDKKLSDRQHVLDVNSYGDVQYLKSILEQNKDDVSNLVLKISLKKDGADILPEFTKYIPYFENLYSCINQGQGTLDNNNYYVPMCLWKDVETPYPYTPADLALMAGIVDGGITTLVDLYKLGVGTIKLSDAYGPRLLLCENPQVAVTEYAKLGFEIGNILQNLAINANPINLPDGLILDLEGFKEIIIIADLIEKGEEFSEHLDEKLRELYNWLSDLKQLGSEAYRNFQNGIKELKQLFGIESVNISDYVCIGKESARKTRKQTIEVLQVLTELSEPANEELRNKIVDAIKTAIDQYLDATLSTDNFARYNQGRILFEVISEIVIAIYTGGTVTGVKLADRASDLLNQTKKLADALSTVTQIAVKKINNVQGITVINNKVLTNDGKLLLEMTEGGMDIKRLLPENAQSLTPVPNSQFKNVDVKLPGDLNSSKQDIDIVEYKGQMYVRVLNKADTLSKYLNINKLPLPQEVVEKLSKWPDRQLIKLNEDLETKTFSSALSKNTDLIDSWETVVKNPMIRKDIKTLESIDKIISNTDIISVLNRSDLGNIVNKLAQKGVKCRTCTGGNSSYKFLDQILDDILFGAIKYGDKYRSVLVGFKQGGNFAEGAMFVAHALKRYENDFPTNSVFEFTAKTTADNIRRVDVKVPNRLNGNKDVFFEFKSVKDVPPSGFATQFIKDMDLPGITDIAQIKWLFDGNKVSSLPKKDFIDALENVTISRDIINKLVKTGPKTKEALIDLIDDNFDLIFTIK